MPENHSPEKDPYEEFSKLAKDLKEQANTEGLLKALEEISLHIRKQDGQNHDLINLLGKMDAEFPQLGELLKKLAETQPQILERLEKIEKNGRPKSLTRKATIASLKAPFQFVGGIVKTVGMTVGIPAFIAVGVYVGNGNDPMDIPQNLADWAKKHDIMEKLESFSMPSLYSNELNVEAPTAAPIEPK